MSRQTRITTAVVLTAAAIGFTATQAVPGKYKGQWKAGGSGYVKDDTVFTIAAGGEALKQGDTLYWKAAWGIDKDVPGEFLDSGGTSGWKYQNSKSAKPKSPAFKFIGVTEANALAAGKAILPTWRNGAQGAYSITHDDYSGMDWETQVRQGYELEVKYGIRTVYGAVVNKTNRELPQLREMISKGYEVMSHSWNHNSAADQWQEFVHGDTIPYGLPEDIPEDVAEAAKKAGLTITTDPAIHQAEVYWTAKLNKEMKFGGKVVDTSEYDTTPNSYKIVGNKVVSNCKIWSDDANGYIRGLNLFCVYGWYKTNSTPGNPEDQDSNVVLAKKVLDDDIWSTLPKEGNKYFRAGRKTEFYIYPYDAYSEKTHAVLYKAGYISARGGAKSGMPIPGDFVHPYRIDFDAFYSIDGTVGDGTDLSKNPHQKLGLKEMCEKIIQTHGYMIRETHAVVPKFEDYWGGVTISEWEKHMIYLKEKQDKNELWISTCAEVVKYRMTANKVTSPVVTGTGKLMTLKVTLDPAFDARYADEICVLVKVPAGADTLTPFGARYVGGSAKNPRNMPQRISEGLYAVYIDPVIGTTVEFGTGVEAVSISDKSVVSSKTAVASFNGCVNSQLSLTIPVGNFTAQVFNLNGRMIRNVDLTGVSEKTPITIPLTGLGDGMYILSIKSAEGISILQDRFMLK